MRWRHPGRSEYASEAEGFALRPAGRIRTPRFDDPRVPSEVEGLAHKENTVQSFMPPCGTANDENGFATPLGPKGRTGSSRRCQPYGNEKKTTSTPNGVDCFRYRRRLHGRELIVHLLRRLKPFRQAQGRLYGYSPDCPFRAVRRNNASYFHNRFLVAKTPPLGELGTGSRNDSLVLW
jgi:hypothetical protein